MILRTLLSVCMLVGMSAPAVAADRTTLLLEELDRCDVRVPATLAPKLNVLLALADGRSASELAGVLRGPRQCIGDVTWFGAGADELVFVGGLGGGLPTGALLWVDRGYWRTTAMPFGYSSGTGEVRRHGEQRDFIVGIASGGSAGTIGLLGVRVMGASASVTFRLVPGGEIREVRWVDDDHFYVAGRLTSDRLFTWMSHAAWPYGAQWLFERRDDSFALVASRQSRDPDWLMTGFVGALLDRDAATMKRFATDGAIAEALDLPGLDRRIDGLRLVADRDFSAKEQLSWSLLPDGVRTSPAQGPVYGYFTNYDYWVKTVVEVGMRFDRDGDGWTITAVRQITRYAAGPHLED